ERVVVEPEGRRLLLVRVVVGVGDEGLALLGEARRPPGVGVAVVLRQHLVAVQVDDGRDRTGVGLGAGLGQRWAVDAVVGRRRAERIGPVDRLIDRQQLLQIGVDQAVRVDGRRRYALLGLDRPRRPRRARAVDVVAPEEGSRVVGR